MKKTLIALSMVISSFFVYSQWPTYMRACVSITMWIQANGCVYCYHCYAPDGTLVVVYAIEEC